MNFTTGKLNTTQSKHLNDRFDCGISAGLLMS